MSWFDLVRLAIMIVLPVVGALVALLKWGLAGEKAQLARGDADNARRASGNAVRIDRLENRMNVFEATLPEKYVQRTDWVPQIAVLDSRIERLADTLHVLVGEFRAWRKAIEDNR